MFDIKKKNMIFLSITNNIRKIIQSLNNFVFFIFSVYPIESSNINFEKINRRIEHITRLNADARKNYSEPFMVKISYDTNMKVFT